MSADPREMFVVQSALVQLRKENEELKKQLEDSASKELTVSILKGAEVELANMERALRMAANEMAKSRNAICAFIAKLNPPT